MIPAQVSLVGISFWVYILLAGVLGLAAYNFVNLKKHDEGPKAIKDIAAIIRSGAETFRRSQYGRILSAVVILSVGYSILSERYAGMCLATGAILVLIAGEFGMQAGTYGNARTASAALVTKANSRTLRIGTLTGSIGAFTTIALGLGGFSTLTLLCWLNGPNTMGTGLFSNIPVNIISSRLTAYSLGFSIVALFARVGGGVYTKAADIGGDIVGKGRFKLPEDDARNVCSIADFVGDMVADLYANLCDIGESYVATLMTNVVIAIQSFSFDLQLLEHSVVFIIALAASGLAASVVSVMFIIIKNKKRRRWELKSVVLERQKTDGLTMDEEKSLQDNVTRSGRKGEELLIEYSPVVEHPRRELTNATLVSAIITIVFGFIHAKWIFSGVQLPEDFLMGWISPATSAAMGIISSVIGGMLTSVYTDTEGKHVRGIAEQAAEGPSFVISEGIALGNNSAFHPMLIISVAVLASYIACGSFFGIAIAAVGVLSFAATTITIDAFGPTADNAGGIAESAHLDPETRTVTDRCDSAGNVTAAIGKTSAIEAAAFSTLTMLAACLGNVPDLNLNNPAQLVLLVVGGIIGVAVIMKFIFILIGNTLKAARKLADEAERQLEDPAIMNGVKTPEYDRAIAIASKDALRSMSKPAILSVATPIVVGFLMGPSAMIGALLGATLIAIGQAFYNSNAGGAWDNAKKFIEMGMLPGVEKNSPAHLATIIGDMVGDILKDVVAVCLDICIKIMAVISVATISFFAICNALTILFPSMF